ncbi:MAG: HEAT repeat domain-containing protein, partial [Steroidobacteraceae bacterium]
MLCRKGGNPLGEARMSETLGTVIEKLRHPDRNVRANAALALGKEADASAAVPLVQALSQEPHFFTREYITWSLVRMGDAAVLPLMQVLTHENPVARQSAAHALSKIGDPRAGDALISALRDTDAKVISKAAFALGRIGDTRVIAVLISLLGHEDRELQSTLVAVLEEFGAAAVQSLIEALTHDDWRIREQAADILRLIGSREPVTALIKASSD